MSKNTFKALNPKRSSVIDYTAHKSWQVSDETAGSFGIKVLSGSYDRSEFYSTDPKTEDYYQSGVFNSIKHLYYSDPKNTTISGDSEFLDTQERELLSYVQVVSVPSNIYGKRIKPGTVSFDAGEDYWDDAKGNLYSDSIYTRDTIQYAPPLPSSTYVYLSFDEERELSEGSSLSTNYKLKYRSDKVKDPITRNSKIVSGRRQGTDPYNHPLAYKAIALNGSASNKEGSESVIELRNSRNPYSSDWDNDFCINMWVQIPASQSVSQSYTGYYSGVDKLRSLKPHTENVIASSRGFTNDSQDDNITPWEISVVNHSGDSSEVGKIYARRGMYKNMIQLSSTTAHNSDDGMWTHIIFQKTGSEMQLMVGSGSTNTGDGNATWNHDAITASLQTAQDPLLKHDTNTEVDICIGARRSGFKQWKGTYPNINYYNPAYTLPFSGSIDEFVIYNHALTIDGDNSQVTNMHKYTTNPVAGNVFYNHGIITLTNPFKEGEQETVDNFNLRFSGSVDVTSHNYRCVVENDTFNMTLNPTARKGYSLTNQYVQSFVTGSEFTPYITTIGLYNQMKELIAIGKLAQPVKSPQDFDITFVVQFDT